MFNLFIVLLYVCFSINNILLEIMHLFSPPLFFTTLVTTTTFLLLLGTRNVPIDKQES